MMQNHRNTDPPTSAMAGHHAETTGRAKEQRIACLELVVRRPGLTAREIEQCIGIKAHKRLPELRAQGLIANGDTRLCRTSGRQAMTWYSAVPNTIHPHPHRHPHPTQGDNA